MLNLNVSGETKYLANMHCQTIMAMAATAGCGNVGAPAFKLRRLKPEIFKTDDGKVIVEDELLNFLAVKIKTLSQEEIVLLATNTFESEAIEASKKVLFEVCPGTSQRCVAHKGQNRDANNIKLCLKVLNECGENIPRFVSHYLDELPPVTFTSLDVSYLLRRMEQLYAEVVALKHITEIQTGVSETARADTEEINRRVTVLECLSANSPSVAAVATSRPTDKASHRGPGSMKEPVPASGVREGDVLHERGAADLRALGDAARAMELPIPSGVRSGGMQRGEDQHQGDESADLNPTRDAVAARNTAPVEYSGDGSTVMDVAVRRHATGAVAPSGSPRWSTIVKNGKPVSTRVKAKAAGSALGGHTSTTVVRKRSRPAPIIGTGTVSTIKTVKTKIVNVFATKFSPDLDADTLADYLQSKLNRTVTCQKIDHARSRFGSFKVTAECNEVTEMYNPELWPEGALIRRYYEPRNVPTGAGIDT